MIIKRQDKGGIQTRKRPSLSSSPRSDSETDPRQFIEDRTLLILSESEARRAHKRQEEGEREREGMIREIDKGAESRKERRKLKR